MVRISSSFALVALSLSTVFAAPGVKRDACAAGSVSVATSASIATSSIVAASAAGAATATTTSAAAGARVTTVNAGAAAVGKGAGNQFTVGGCIDNADCATQCCAGGAVSGSTGRLGVGVCSGQGAGVEFQKGKTGCGFQDPNAALTLQEAAAQVAKQGF